MCRAVQFFFCSPPEWFQQVSDSLDDEDSKYLLVDTLVLNLDNSSQTDSRTIVPKAENIVAGRYELEGGSSDASIVAHDTDPSKTKILVRHSHQLQLIWMRDSTRFQ